MNKYIPSKQLRGNKKQKPWVSREVKTLILKRDKLFKKQQRTKNSKDIQSCKETKARLQKAISMRLNVSILSDSSIDTHVNHDLDTSNDVNTSNDMKLNVTMPDNTLSIKVVCINVCGLLSKLRYPDFDEFCQSYHIACLVENKLSSLDSLAQSKKNLNQDLVGL